MSAIELDVTALQAEALLTDKAEPLVYTYWRRFRRHKLAMVSLFLLTIIILTTIIGPIILTRQITQANRVNGFYQNTIPFVKNNNNGVGNQRKNPLPFSVDF